MSISEQGHELHFMAGFVVMIVFAVLYSDKAMSSSAAFILGLLSLFTMAYGKEVYDIFYHEEDFDGLDITFSLLGAVIPSVGLMIYSILKPEQKELHIQFCNENCKAGRDAGQVCTCS